MFEKSYHSFIDIQAVRKLREGIKYILKYLSKTQYMVQSQELTLALCWLFKKRFFAISGDLYEAIYTMTNMHVRFIQTDLFSYEIYLKVIWIFIGIFPASKLGIDRNEWRRVITNKAILESILSYQ